MSVTKGDAANAEGSATDFSLKPETLFELDWRHTGNYSRVHRNRGRGEPTATVIRQWSNRNARADGQTAQGRERIRGGIGDI